jgi:nitrogen fixation protein FixH
MWRITIVFVVFLSFIISMVAYTAFLETDLVAEDYYQQEVNYQDIIEAKKNSVDLKSKIVIQQDDNFLSIHFPEALDLKGVVGTVHFYHPKYVKFDVKEQLDLSENNSQAFKKKGLQKGNYTIKMKWDDNGKSYYIEKTYYIS